MSRLCSRNLFDWLKDYIELSKRLRIRIKIIWKICDFLLINWLPLVLIPINDTVLAIILVLDSIGFQWFFCVPHIACYSPIALKGVIAFNWISVVMMLSLIECNVLKMLKIIVQQWELSWELVIFSKSSSLLNNLREMCFSCLKLIVLLGNWNLNDKHKKYWFLYRGVQEGLTENSRWHRKFDKIPLSAVPRPISTSTRSTPTNF